VIADAEPWLSRSHHTIRADYLVAADGHRRPIRAALEIGTHGRGTLSHNLMWLIRADIPDITDEHQILYYLQNPQLHGSGGVVVSTDHRTAS
jgi:2-polyprenyl-6-methoxyphenol hydroxylase-like FAD-dependent oxidoreductase